MTELLPSSYNVEEVRAAINDAFSGTATFNVITAKNIHSPFITLTDGATITWDLSSGSNAFVTLGGNRSLEISGAKNGSRGTIFVEQDGVGNRKLSLGGISSTHYVKDGGSGIVTLTAKASSIDKLSFYCVFVMANPVFYWKVERDFT